MWNKTIILFFLLFVNVLGISQECQLTLSGVVLDHNTSSPLELVNIYIQEAETGDVSSLDGKYKIEGLCPGKYHITFSHIGCHAHQIFIAIERDTFITITLDHSDHLLESIVVNSDKDSKEIQAKTTINQQAINDESNTNLSNLIKSIPGVSSLNNGVGIAKPVVHGMFGNRVTILNNGIPQSGQQWGNDHAPEIDPQMAQKISVIKGVSALEYQGSNHGSLILIEPGFINKEPHLHGKINTYYESNGNALGLNLNLQKYTPKIAWKIIGTIKKSGDRKTPDYFLTNTGSTENNLAVFLEKSMSTKWQSKLHISTFNTELGILRGSHIGNLTDLEEALTREEPFFTSNSFSYNIEAPKQKVNHHFIKWSNQYFINNKKWVDFNIASQINNREEFDVRRSGKSELPALSLLQLTQNAEVKYNAEYDNNLTLKTGLQFNLTDNTNNPETEILPLIPDYISFETDYFLTFAKKLSKTQLNAGIRYENTVQNVAAISKSLPREIIRYENIFHNYKFQAGINHSLYRDYSVGFNIGFSTRNPAINELYSGGLHQGVSGIEEGNTNLATEAALKSTLSFVGSITNNISFQSLIYFQQIENYIYLNPSNEYRLTIRGAFPVFTYEQTKAQIYGLDLSTQIQFSKTLSSTLSYAYIRGLDLSNDLPLINIPSNDLKFNLTWSVPNLLKQQNSTIENIELSIQNQTVFKQTHLEESQDFLAAPSGYNLIHIKASGEIKIKNQRLRLVVKCNNLLNTSYRDYLNRLRYFADDLGRNVVVGASLIF